MLPDIDWVRIPAGSFVFGGWMDFKDSSSSLAERITFNLFINLLFANTRKKIKLPAFYMARYPITYAQFQTFIDAGKEGFYNEQWWQGLDAPKEDRASPGQQDFQFWNHPRERVSWYDATAFCRWLSHHTDQTIRLPTEFEWERLARGNNGNAFAYGNQFDEAKANTEETKIRQTSAVGIFPNGASTEGVMDLTGNVSEWCLEEHRNLLWKTLLRFALKERNVRVLRVLRGGSWGNLRDFARAAVRDGYPPVDRYDYVGVRGVCESAPAPPGAL